MAEHESLQAEPESLEAELERWLGSLDSLTYYQVLGAPETADPAQIREAFHEFSRRFHPDMLREQDAPLREKARRIFTRGAEAYAVLRVDKRRADYDLELAKGRKRLHERDEKPAEDTTASQRRSLEDVCQSAGGKLHARQAARALSEGHLKEAASLLRKAVFAEPRNTELAERLRSLEEWIKMGAS